MLISPPHFGCFAVWKCYTVQPFYDILFLSINRKTTADRRMIMFFICGTGQGKKMIDFAKTVICNLCGGYGRYQVFMTYSYFSIFFIPVMKWNRHYYVQMSCCNALYELDPEKGKRLRRKESVDISENELTLVQSGHRNAQWGQKSCSSCGYETTEDFEYCPKCGKRF